MGTIKKINYNEQNTLQLMKAIDDLSVEQLSVTNVRKNLLQNNCDINKSIEKLNNINNQITNPTLFKLKLLYVLQIFK